MGSSLIRSDSSRSHWQTPYAMGRLSQGNKRLRYLTKCAVYLEKLRSQIANVVTVGFELSKGFRLLGNRHDRRRELLLR